MPRNHQVQHRSKRDAKEIKDTEREIRAELQKCKREIARLRSELAKRIEPIIDAVDEAEAMVKSEPKTESPKCPDCSSTDLTKLTLIKTMWIVCKQCHWRQKDE